MKRTAMAMGRAWAAMLCAWAIAGVGPAPVAAHGGSPRSFVDAQQVGPYTVSVYGDADVGAGKFYIEVLLNGAAPPPGTAVALRAAPDTARPATTATYQARLEQESEEGHTFVATVPFAREGRWDLQLALDGPGGAARTAFKVQVESQSLSWLAPLLSTMMLAGLASWWLSGVLRDTQRE